MTKRHALAGAVLLIALVVAIFLVRLSFGGFEGFCVLIYPPPESCLDHHVVARVAIALVGVIAAAAIAFLPRRKRRAT